MQPKSPIQEFYSNQTILIFGVSGFIGKVLLEKILFSCSDVARIYVVLRQKKNQTAEQRMEEILKLQCFDRLKKKFSNFASKISVLEGDCTEEFCGLSSPELSLLQDNVTVCFNFVADVRMTQSLKQSIEANVRPNLYILAMVKKMTKLRAFVYVSTAYSNFPKKDIDEIFYKSILDANTLLRFSELPDAKLKDITSKLIQGWPNTYTFCKQVNESYLQKEGKAVPMAICRPSLVSYSYEEPLPGWADSYLGLVGPQIAILLGTVRVFFGDETPLHFVPCDYLVNNLLAIAWSLNQQENVSKDIPIYNVVGGPKTLTYAQIVSFSTKIARELPVLQTVAYPTCILTSNKIVYICSKFVFHTLFAYLMDFLLICFIRKKPRYVKQYDTINKMLDGIAFFSTTSLNFHSNNVKRLWQQMEDRDRQLFNFKMDDNFDWEREMRNGHLHIRKFFFHKSLDNVDKAKRRIIFLLIVHWGVRIILFWFFYKMFCYFF